ncbi:MAG: putative serine/threonine-protein phosphatase 5 [Streblomastix strix]|uniref:Putative serine/threonine-protein phosphatase 5 n=1 Tax=Streblomastix strix TaxID=222440 RepID=A0A5J4WPT3_9EUKA|nr:MAG: putative serine/threonine-protein phosphatase 5 [Streblomastix strix]
MYQSQLEQIEELKHQGNISLANHQYDDAIKYYTDAINFLKLQEAHQDLLAVLHSNRSFVYSRQENYQHALDDAQIAIQTDMDYVKAYYRRGTAYLGLRNFDGCLEDLRICSFLVPESRLAADRLQMCQEAIAETKLLRKLTSKENGIPAIPDWRMIDYPDDYNGPKIDDENDEENDEEFKEQEIDGKFVEQLLIFVENMKPNDIIPERLVLQLIDKALYILSQEPTLVEVNDIKEIQKRIQQNITDEDDLDQQSIDQSFDSSSRVPQPQSEPVEQHTPSPISNAVNIQAGIRRGSFQVLL